MSVVSNENLDNFTASNESVNTAQVTNALNPSTFQNVKFNSTINPVIPVSFSGPPSYQDGTTVIHNLIAEELVQSVVSYLTIIGGASTYPVGTENLLLSLGEDSSSNAESLISFFNLSENNPFVLANFYLWPITSAGSITISFNNTSYPSDGTYVVFPSVILFYNPFDTLSQLTTVRFEYNSPTQITVRIISTVNTG